MTIDKELNKLKKDELISIITDTIDVYDIKLELNRKYIERAEKLEIEAHTTSEWLDAYASTMKFPTRMMIEKYKQQNKLLVQAGKYYDKGSAILGLKIKGKR